MPPSRSQAAQHEPQTVSAAQTEVATRVATARRCAGAARRWPSDCDAGRLQGEERAAPALDDGGAAAAHRRDRAHEGELAREAHGALTALDTEAKALAADIAARRERDGARRGNLAAQARLRDARLRWRRRAKAASEAASASQCRRTTAPQRQCAGSTPTRRASIPKSPRSATALRWRRAMPTVCRSRRSGVAAAESLQTASDREAIAASCGNRPTAEAPPLARSTAATLEHARRRTPRRSALDQRASRRLWPRSPPRGRS